MPDHKEIFLAPPDEEDPIQGRMWCEDDGNWDRPGTRYVRGDIADALVEIATRARDWLTSELVLGQWCDAGKDERASPIALRDQLAAVLAKKGGK